MPHHPPGSEQRCYEVTKHVSDGGGGSLAGTLQMASILTSIGVVLGFAASYVSQWFYLVFLFPLGMGAVLGIVGGITIDRYKIRRPLVCGAAGFLAGCFCLLAMHYCDYQRLEGKLGEISEEAREVARHIDQLAAQGDQQPPEVRKLIADLRGNPALLRILKIQSFWDFMSYQAEEGVTISGKHGNGFNLGYTGSFIYWGVEALLLAGVSWAMMMGAASKPFCTECESWKKERPILVSPMPPKKVAAVVKEGDLAGLESILASTDASEIKAGVSTKLMAHICENCADMPFEIKVVQVTVNAKQEKSESELALITFPSTAWSPLEEMVERVTTPANSNDETSETEPSA